MSQLNESIEANHFNIKQLPHTNGAAVTNLHMCSSMMKDFQ